MGEEIRDKAFEDYKKGMKYKEIAEKYGVSLGTVQKLFVIYLRHDGIVPFAVKIIFFNVYFG